jgi:hypothetical protein
MHDVLVKYAYGDKVYDAFWGSGWKSWTRFLYRGGKVIYIKGKAVDAAELAILTNVVADLK